MIILISGTTHTGKTALAQRLLVKYNMPYYSIDHLKMGLIRSGQTELSVNDDAELVTYLWPIVKEIIITAIENNQNLIVEGCYIPFDWQKDFSAEYLCKIKYYCLIMTKKYIENNFSKIVEKENIIERRAYDSGLTKEKLIADNSKNLQLCKRNNLNYILIDENYDVDIEL